LKPETLQLTFALTCSRDLRSFEIRFEFESDVLIRDLIWKWRADSKISNQPHMPCAVIPQTTLTNCSTKNINLYTVCSWDLCLQLHFTCSCTTV